MQVHFAYWSYLEILFTASSPSAIRLFSFSCAWRSKYAFVPPFLLLFLLFPLRPCLPRLMKARGRIFFPFLKPPAPAPQVTERLLHCNVHQNVGHNPSPYTAVSVQELPTLLPDWGPIRLHNGFSLEMHHSSLSQTQRWHWFTIFTSWTDFELKWSRRRK